MLAGSFNDLSDDEMLEFDSKEAFIEEQRNFEKAENQYQPNAGFHGHSAKTFIREDLGDK